MKVVEVNGEKYVLLSEVSERLQQAESSAALSSMTLMRKMAEFQGPDGFSDWRDAAVSERLQRIQIQRLLDGADRVGEWVGVDERLPDPHELVLVAGRMDSTMRIAIGAIDRGEWWLKGCSWKPEFWMPLPSMPIVSGGSK